MTKKIQQQLIALSAILALLMFVYFSYIYKPLSQKCSKIYDEVKKMEAKLNDTKKRALELPKLQFEMKVLEQEVADLEKLLPKDKEIPELLRTITKTAQTFQLKISNFQPEAVAQLPNYNEIPFKVTLKGSYHSLAAFLAELGQEQRILNSRNLVLNGLQATKDNPSTIDANFSLLAYTFMEQK